MDGGRGLVQVLSTLAAGLLWLEPVRGLSRFVTLQGFQDIGAFLWRGKFPLRNPSREGSCGRHKGNRKG